MSKKKHRRAADHMDNYRRGGLRFNMLGGRFLNKQNIELTDLTDGFSTLQGGAKMNGINNPLGALTALAGLAQNKSDPMAAISALSALNGNAAGAGAGAGSNPADLLSLLSTLRPPQAAPAPPPNTGRRDNTPPPPPSDNASRQSDMRQNESRRNKSNREGQSKLRQKVQSSYAEEPKTPCDNCRQGCAKSFRNYPSWQQVNLEAAPWKKS